MKADPERSSTLRNLRHKNGWMLAMAGLHCGAVDEVSALYNRTKFSDHVEPFSLDVSSHR